MNDTAKRDNEGVLGKNQRKTTDRHPDLSGQCTIDGVAYWISGWKRQKHSDGSTFYSLSFRPKDEQAAKPAPPKRDDGGMADMDEDIPF